MAFELVWTEQAQKELKKLETVLAKRIFEKIVWANESNVLFLEKVQASSLVKYRVGSYRVFFEKGPETTLFVLSVQHRSKAYQRIKK